MGYQEIGLGLVGPEFVQQVVDALGQLQHALAAAVVVGKLHFGGGEIRAVARRGALIAAKALLPQAGLRPGRQAGGRSHGQCGVGGAGEGRIQNFVDGGSAGLDLLAQCGGLGPALLGEGAVRHAADLVLYVPDGLAVAGKVNTVHGFSLF